MICFVNINIAVTWRGKARTSSERLQVRHCIVASEILTDSRTNGKLIKLEQIV